MGGKFYCFKNLNPKGFKKFELRGCKDGDDYLIVYYDNGDILTFDNEVNKYNNDDEDRFDGLWDRIINWLVKHNIDYVDVIKNIYLLYKIDNSIIIIDDDDYNMTKLNTENHQFDEVVYHKRMLELINERVVPFIKDYECDNFLEFRKK